MNLKKYYFGILILFLGFVGFYYLKNNWIYYSAKYNYNFNKLNADELNNYAALLYYKNRNDWIRIKEGDEATEAKSLRN